MLIIRAAQMKALDKAAEETYLAFVADDIERRWPARFSSLGADSATARIAGSYKRAKGYGLRKKTDVAWFIQMDFLLGEEFERFPGLQWAVQILESDLPGETKVYRLQRRFARAGISISRVNAAAQTRTQVSHGE